MSGDVWWGRSAAPEGRGRTVAGPGPSGGQPELVEATRERVRAEIGARLPAYTPDWSNPDRSDAGVALVRLFGAQTEPVLRRLNRLPEKLLVEHLITAGVRALPAAAASTLLQFTVTPPDGGSVLVPAGFQTGAAPTTGDQPQVIFETRRGLWATPATIGAVLVEQEGRRQPIAGVTAGANRSFPAFGAHPEPGNALWIGLAGAANPFPAVSLGFIIAAPGAPGPVSAGGDAAPDATGPLLRWEILDGNQFVAVPVGLDNTGGLRTSGVVELRVPRTWRPGRPSGPSPQPELRWLRITLAHGEFPAPPVLTRLTLNVVDSLAVRTVRSEAPRTVQSGPVDGRTRVRLSQVPVLPGSVLLEVEDDVEGDVFGTVAAPASRWREVESLGDRGPDERVFTLDPETGEITFGDGVHGAKVPLGFRTVVAQSYRVGGGTAGAVRAESVTSLVTSLAYVTGVTNPFPAEGGADAEPVADTMRRGAAQLSAGGRAVTPDDYALLALRAPGALVARAHGVAGLDLERPGRPVPGVVGVLVVPDVPATDDPPIPTPATLRAVAAHLTAAAAPAGVRVVAGPATFQRVAIDAWVVIDPEAERAGVLTAAGDALMTYLDPVRGGDGGGWPFGGPLRHSALLRRLLAVPGVLAVPRLRPIVDGVPAPPCADRPLRPHALPWPARPNLIPVDDTAGGTP